MINKPDFNQINDKRISFIHVLEYILIICLLLYWGRTLLVPLGFSVLISFILYPVCKNFERKGIGRNIAILITVSIFSILLGVLLFFMIEQILEFSKEWLTLKSKILNTLTQLSLFVVQQFGFSAEQQLIFVKNSVNNSGAQLFNLLQSTLISISGSFYFIFMVPIFSILILSNRRALVDVLCITFSTYKKETILDIVNETIHAYYNFIKGMILVYFIVGLLNSIGLLILGIPHPFLFGYFASVLTFIPYIGIMIASLLPISVAWITFNSIYYPIGVIAIFTIVQILEAYIIFPFAVSNRMNLSTLFVLIFIILGGIIWGASGMILFIPLLSIIKLIADRTHGLESIAKLLDSGSLKRISK
jgi:predicted PurR-regulated permease PerM